MKTSQAFWKVEAHRIPPEELRDKHLKGDEVIVFSEADVTPNQTSHTDTLVIKIIVATIEIRRVYVDTRATVSVLYLSYFQTMGMDLSSLKPYAPLLSFTQGEVQPEGIIQLPKKVGPYSQQHTTMISVYVVDSPSAYNVILEEDCLTPNKVVCSTYHLMVKFHTPYGIAEVRRDKKTSRYCMKIALKHRKRIEETGPKPS